MSEIKVLKFLKVLQPPAKPVPFFPRTSHHGVTDYFKGDVFRVREFTFQFSIPNIHLQAFSDAGQYENSLFMFYAPWDRASQEARQTLIEVIPWKEMPPLEKKNYTLKRNATPWK